MRIVKIILIIAVIIVACAISATFFMPRKLQFENHQFINAPVHVVYNQVNNILNWENWSPWSLQDQTIAIDYNKTKSGEGAGYKWYSTNKKIGEGKLEIVNSVFLDTIIINVQFSYNTVASGIFIFEKADSGTTIIWNMDIELDFDPISKIRGYFNHYKSADFYYNGLTELADICKNIPEYTVYKTSVVGFNYLGITTKCLNAEIGEKMGYNYMELSNYLTQNDIAITNAPIAIYYSYNDIETEFEVGFPIDSKPPKRKKYNFGEIPTGNYVTTLHYGAYNDLIDAYIAINQFIADSNYAINGLPWEQYLTNPEKEPDTSKWMTRIYFPVQMSKEIKENL